MGFDGIIVMKLRFIVLTCFLLSLTHGRPNHSVSQEQLARVHEEAIIHFGPPKDYTNLDIPPIKGYFDEPDNEHPYRFNFTNDGSGNYYFGFDTFVLMRYEIGELKNVDTDNEIQSVRGQYQDRYVNEDGVHIVRTIGYVADENGYRPFLIGLSFVLSTASEPKKGLSSAALGSLIGGNSLG
ncbi:uncharacterized protein LOC123013583 [Tribolium madens]|uniref:uncharacterized protein LOC123013583 n=1 Tax=Tribolium madens TaxID=41895 RepID=UPI001CF75ED3|nr:uncharacterized protein LOC123013583 [Tribolium madens]